MSFTSLALTGTCHNPDGSALAGATVRLKLSTAITDGSTDVVPAPLTAVTASDGTFTIADVVPNDDTTTTPVGTFYTVTVTTGANPALIIDYFDVVIPHASAPTVDLFSLSRLGTPASPVYPYLSSLDGIQGQVTLGSPDGSVTIGQSGQEITLEASTASGGVTVASTVTSSGTLAVSKLTPCDATTGALSMALPTGQSAGKQLEAQKIDSTANTVTLTGNIRGVGSASLALKLQYEGILLVADSSGSWWPMGDHKTLSSLDARYVEQTEVGAASGVASLDSGSHVPVAQLPSSVVSVTQQVEQYSALDGPQTVDRSGVTDTSTALQAALAAVAAIAWGTIPSVTGSGTNPVNQTLFLPDGTYKINTALQLPQGVNLVLSPGAILKAGASIDHLLDTPVGTQFQDQSIQGGIWDCNSLATTAIIARYFAHMNFKAIRIYDSLGNAMQLGDTAAAASSYEPIVDDLYIWRAPGVTVPAGAYGLWVSNATDGEYGKGTIVGSDIGVRVDSGGSTFSHYHVWGFSAQGFYTTSFDDNSPRNIYIGCKADSPNTYGWHLRNSSTQILGGLGYRASNASDNTATGVYADNASSPLHIVEGLVIVGVSASARWAADIGGVGAPGISYTRSLGTSNVVAPYGAGSQIAQTPNKVILALRNAATGSGDALQHLSSGASIIAKLAGTGIWTAPAYRSSGLSGSSATIGGGYVGCTTTGPPTGAAFVKGDFCDSQDGNFYICTVSGTPGTWEQASVPLTDAQKYNDLLGFSFDPSAAATLTTVLPAAATLYLARVPIPANPITVTNLWAYLGALGTTSASNAFLAMFKSDGTIIGQTADQGSAWITGGTTGAKEIAIAGGPVVVTPLAADDFVWVAPYVGTAGGTLPAFARNGGTTAFFNIGTSTARSRFGQIAQASTASLASITPGSISQASTDAWWAGIS